MSARGSSPRDAIFPPYCQIDVNNAAEAAKATEDNIKGGVDVIQAQGGLNYEELKAIASTAHKHNIRFTPIYMMKMPSATPSKPASATCYSMSDRPGTPPSSPTSSRRLSIMRGP